MRRRPPVARRRYLVPVDDDGMLIEVWSDVVCSWCYQGKRHLERALTEFPERDRVAIRWRSFELDPTIAADVGLADQEPPRRRNISLEEARAMHEVTEQQGLELGIRFDFSRAHRASLRRMALQMAHQHGVQDAVNERLMATYFCEGGAIGDPATVAAAAGQAGLTRRPSPRCCDASSPTFAPTSRRPTRSASAPSRSS